MIMDKSSTIVNKNTLQRVGAENYLGTSSRRYFSDGYKDIKHYFNDIRIEKEMLYANLVLEWPEKWSEKKGVSITPHIGTLDFFLASAILVEKFFQAMNKGFVDIIKKMWVTLLLILSLPFLCPVVCHFLPPVHKRKFLCLFSL